MDTITYCIFCRTPTKDEPEEHIALEGLFGDQLFDVSGSSIAMPPRKLILDNDEMCGGCNGTLGAELDAYLIAQYGFLRTLWNPVGTKSGKPATAAQPGMYARHSPNGPELFLNTGRRPAITPDGLKIMPAGTKERAVRVERFEVKGRTGSIDFQQPMRLNKRFMRALHKIGFELLCFQKGPAFVLQPEFDALRDYIRYGKGSRNVILTMSAAGGTCEKPSFSLEHRPDWPGWLATIRLLATFQVDVSPGSHFLAKVDVEELHRDGLMFWSDRGGGTFSLNQGGLPNP